MEDVENIELLDATIVNHVENDQSVNFIPRVGLEFVSEEEAYNFYNEYGRRYGFSIRKENGNWNKKTRQLTSRLFVCSKEGIRSSDKRDHQTKNARAETRTDCGARMLIKFNKHSGKFQIKEIVVEHNHPSYELMRRQAGGHDGLGYSKEDLKNYLGSKRRRALKYGEAGTLLRKLKIYCCILIIGKKPKTIFTDQDASMANAIPLVMPETYHRLCLFHMMENALRHLGPKFSEESGLPRELSNCVYAFEEENELSKAWEDMIDRHELIDNNWVKEIYKVKEKWAKAYVKRTFSAEISSTQISESFNSSLKDHLQPDMNLVQFFGHFERVLNDKRYNELKSEFDLRQKLPKLKMKTPMLKQAGEIYTAAMLDKFQYEYEKFQATFVEEKKETDDHLPDHTLKVLDLMNIKLIPDRYILKRWTKHARDGNVQDFDGHDVEVDPNHKWHLDIGEEKGDPMQHSSKSRNVSSHSQTYQELDKGNSMPDYRAWTHDESQVISHPNFSEMLMEAMTPNSYGGFDVPSQFLDQNRLNEEQDDLLSQVGIFGDVSNASNMKSH
ncbi:hypothetical protein COLO4_04687 [Corchorus olitorius]|uniref:Uncharacterized protein n=1 Tax=Corchorus olitorius TaxID=93759 RepID=A0A1R3KT35_9ROSI|nr:hypothetical protein COLO4_04687 [Corchorus olitorius]